jgi:hypothetical protein
LTFRFFRGQFSRLTLAFTLTGFIQILGIVFLTGQSIGQSIIQLVSGQVSF